MSTWMKFPLQPEDFGQAQKNSSSLQNMLLAKKCYFANSDGESIYRTLTTYNSYKAEASVSALSAHVHGEAIQTNSKAQIYLNLE